MSAPYREEPNDPDQSDGARHLWAMLAVIAILIAAATIVMFGELMQTLDALFTGDAPLPTRGES